MSIPGSIAKERSEVFWKEGEEQEPAQPPSPNPIGPSPMVCLFVGIPLSGYAPLSVDFTDLSTHSPTSWAWDFKNDGSATSTLQNPSYVYTTPGTYSVSLSVSNGTESASSTRVAYITVIAPPPPDPPVAEFVGVPLTGIAPLLVDFTDLSTGSPSSWLWSFGDGDLSTSVLQNPSHEYTNPGTYTVSLRATNEGGFSTNVKIAYIVVLPPPPVADFVGNPLSGYAALLVNFTDLSTGSPTSWAWDFKNDGSATSTLQNPSYTYQAPGVYTVKLTATNAGGSDVETKIAYISVSVRPPVAAFSGIPLLGYAPLNVAFTDESLHAPTSWAWDFKNDGSATSTLQNPSYVYTLAGTYSVKLGVSNSGGSDLLTKTAYVVVQDPPPVADFVGVPLSGPAPLTVAFTDLSSGPVTSWAWDFKNDGSMTSTLQNPSGIVYPSPGVYTVKLTVTGPGGSDTNTKVLYITVTGVAPVADFVGLVSSGLLSPYIFFGENGAPDYGVTGDPVTQRNLFLSSVSNPATLNFEGLTPGVYTSMNWTPPAPQSSIGITVTNPLNEIRVDEWDLLVDGPATPTGRYNTSPGGSRWVEFRDRMVLSFSSPISALGFYGTDWGDFNGTITVTFTDTDGSEITFTVPNTTPAANASLLFWGFVNPFRQYTQVRFVCNYAVTPLPGDEDYFGIDDLIIATASAVTTVYGPPVGNAPLTVTFNDLSTNTPTGWAWDFKNDGSATSTLQNPSYVYTTPGTYSVKLTASNAAGSNTMTKVSYVTVLTESRIELESGLGFLVLETAGYILQE